MARMKFICDSERCIECNGCVTACKNENEVPWGVNRRRVVTLNDGVPGERSISVACMHCSDAPCMAVCPVNASIAPRKAWCSTTRTSASDAAIAPMPAPSARRSSRQQRHVRRARQDGQVHLLRRRPRGQRQRRPNSRSTGATGLPKASCRPAPRCARPRRCSAATAMWSPTSSARVWCSAAKAPKSGVGALRTARGKPARRPPEARSETRTGERGAHLGSPVPCCLRREASDECPRREGRCPAMDRDRRAAEHRHGLHRQRVDAGRQGLVGGAPQDAHAIRPERIQPDQVNPGGCMRQVLSTLIVAATLACGLAVAQTPAPAAAESPTLRVLLPHLPRPKAASAARTSSRSSPKRAPIRTISTRPTASASVCSRATTRPCGGR